MSFISPLTKFQDCFEKFRAPKGEDDMPFSELYGPSIENIFEENGEMNMTRKDILVNSVHFYVINVLTNCHNTVMCNDKTTGIWKFTAITFLSAAALTTIPLALIEFALRGALAILAYATIKPLSFIHTYNPTLYTFDWSWYSNLYKEDNEDPDTIDLVDLPRHLRTTSRDALVSLFHVFETIEQFYTEEDYLNPSTVRDDSVSALEYD